MADPVPPSTVRANDIRPHGGAGMLTFLTLGVIVAALYFAREVLVPLALAVLLSFLLAPAVRWLRHLRAGPGDRRLGHGADRVSGHPRLRADRRRGNVAAGASASGIPAQHRAEAAVLPTAIPLHRVATILHRVTADLKRSQASNPVPAGTPASAGGGNAEQAKPLPVEMVTAGTDPLQIAQSVIGPLLQPLATAGLVIVLVVFILLEREEFARPGAQARRRRRSAPHHRGDERGGATGQPLSRCRSFRSTPSTAS